MLKLKRFLFFAIVFVPIRFLSAQEAAHGLKFIENKNQWPEKIHFSARIPGGSMSVSPGKFSYYFIDGNKLNELHDHGHSQISEADGESHGGQSINAHAVEVSLIGSNSESKPRAYGRSDEYYNYFLGTDPCAWASNAYAYNSILYPEIYSGIDLKIYSQGVHMKYDFIVAPNTDPAQIIIQYAGADDMYLDNGNLFIKTTLADMIEKRPVAFQYIEGKKVEVTSEYSLVDNQMSFCFPEGYDPCYELVIDPLLIFSTYSGSAADNWGSTATPGERGNLYSAGVTNHFYGTQFSGIYPATTGAFQTTYGGLYDVGILKYDSAGKKLLYASYLGGSQSESPHSLLMNDAQELIILGTTSSSDFPTSNGAVGKTFKGGNGVRVASVEYNFGADIFVARISKDGTQLLASTYLGGTNNDGVNMTGLALVKNYGDELRGDVIADHDGNIYISSVTSSDNFPVTAGLDTVFNGGGTDALLVKLNPDLTSVLWGTYIGGTGTDASHTIKFDHDENIFIAGGTTSFDFPSTIGSFQKTQAGDADGWIAKIGHNGDTIYHATYTGTNAFDQVYFLGLNDNDEVYVYGQTSGAMPISPGVYNNPNSGQFLQKFSNDLSTRIFSTVFGSGTGLPNISPTAFLVSECNNIYMSGWGGIVNQATGGWNSNTTNMPLTPDARQHDTSGSDFYFIVLAEDATKLLYATYLGGNQSRTHVDGGTSRFDRDGVVYHSVCSGCDAFNGAGNPTSDFPTTPGAWSRVNRSLNCNNAAFKFDLASLKARLDIKDGITKICLPDKIRFRNLSSGGEIYYWDLGDGTKFTLTDRDSIDHEYKNPGEYTIRLIARDPATCRVSDTAYAKVNAYVAQSEVQDDDNICGGEVYQLKAEGGAEYHWRSEDGSFQSEDESPFVSPHDTTVYFVDIIEASGCTHSDQVTLNVVPDIRPDFEMEREAGCLSRPVITVKSLTDSLMAGDQLFFDFGDGTTSDATEIEHFYESDSLYTVKQVAVRDGCVYEKVFQVPVFTMTVPNVITPDVVEGDNDVFTIKFGRGEEVRTPGDYGFKVSLIIYNRWGEQVFQSDDYKYDWAAQNQSAGVYYYEVKIEDHATCKSWVHVIK